MNKSKIPSQFLAAAITKASSKQTYYTIRFFVDHERTADAYRAYAYFRWVDDVIDGESNGCAITDTEKAAFIERQKLLLEACYRRATPGDLCAEERMLFDLVRHDPEENSGLGLYLRNMMDVMLFDAQRRGRIISQEQLSEYSHKLAVAVTEALYYFIGHADPSPDHEARYLAVTAAHITHMLRDTLEDVENGYFNIPGEYLASYGISPREVDSRAYHAWVCSRVRLARRYFKAGRECTAQVRNWRCRLAGCAYTARFEWMLRVIERDKYCLRSEYLERKGFLAGLWMGWTALIAMFASPAHKLTHHNLKAQSVRIGKL